MRKLEKFRLIKADIDQNDILKKKQMQNLWGGLIKGGCTWCCTINTDGVCAFPETECYNSNDCWEQAETHCVPANQYGIFIQCR